MQQLKVGSTLQCEKYRIEKVLGQGGFGITYLAYQELLDRKVCIKEFFFKEYCERDEATSQVSLGTTANKEMVERFMAKFVKEARTISQMEHPNIIRIFDVFKENNTAYYVMEYIEGESLAEMVNRRGCIPEEEALCYIRCVADALDYVHQKHINHLDVKPGNILVRNSDKRVLLIDFGLSKQYDASGNQTSTTPVGISHGYAPIEQYKQNGVQEFSPQTDIYALGATLYKLLSGNTPPQPSDIINDGFPELPSSVSFSIRDAVKQAMQVRKADRLQDIKQFKERLTTENNTVKDYSKENVSENKAHVVHQIADSIDEETVIIEQKNDVVTEKQTVLNTTNIALITGILIMIGFFCIYTSELNESLNDKESALAKKTSVLNRYIENYGDMIITDITFKNTTANGETIGGHLTASRIRYLVPTLKIYGTKNINRTVYVKIFDPHGLSNNPKISPKGYSYSSTLDIYEGERDYELSGWGSEQGGTYVKGTYRIEIWADDKMIFTKSFKLH